MGKRKERTADEVLAEVCEYQLRQCEGRSLSTSDVLPVSDLLRGGFVEFREDGHYNNLLHPTDAGLLRYYQSRVEEYKSRVYPPRTPEVEA